MNKEQWDAISQNNKHYDGLFYYALTTTRTVCRPSCTSRTPNPKHVLIFNDVESAIKEGYRPCTRCKSNQMDWRGYKEEIAKDTMHYIQEHYKEKITLTLLGEALQKNPYYIQRSFKAIQGLSPLHYLHRLRIDEAKHLLRHEELSITEIALEVGYNDSTHFSVKFKEYTGVSPTTYKNSFLIK
ncbi:Ada metal-binding domain-containing protein [Paenibacillus sp. JCM 10914]|uniref:Ada metal-binding domain-containing protein n=1 Tax=Paenibacillus sp. JCM 10914 TaxID=1236974 RepID=UPI000560483E|nr:Ada metal-binding domain-containing protein [Paenibacillus sp. JCM 10914]